MSRSLAKKRRYNIKITNQVLPVLIELFPKAFVPLGQIPTPLKVGIHYEIKAIRPGIVGLIRTLNLYTHSRQYLSCLQEKAHRIDLNGEVCGYVSRKQAQDAKRNLATKVARFSSKKAQGDHHAQV